MQKHGYAREAVAAALTWADTTLEAQKTIAVFDPQNAASLRLAREMGYGEDQNATFRGDPVLILTRPRQIAALTSDHTFSP